jgi:hypothetical protein
LNYFEYINKIKEEINNEKNKNNKWFFWCINIKLWEWFLLNIKNTKEINFLKILL